MGKYIVEFTPAARKDLQKHYQSGNKAVIKRLKRYFWSLLKHLIWEKENRKNSNISIKDIGQDGSIKKIE